MHRIDTPTADSGSWVEADPLTGTPKTVSSAAYLTALQEEMASVPEAVGLELDPNDDGQLAQGIASLAAGHGFRNQLLNGSFRFWQRNGPGNTVVGSTNVYVPDRWLCRAGGNGSATLSRGTFTSPASELQGSEYFLDWNQTVGATSGTCSLRQRMEDVRRLAGCYVTFGGWLRRVSGPTFNIRVRLQHYFGDTGTGDNSIQEVTIGPVSTSFAHYSATMFLPDLVTTPATVDDNSFTELLLLIDTTSTFQLRMAEFEIQVGRYLAPFEHLDPGVELLALNRYYEKSYPPDVGEGVGSADGEVRGHAGASITAARRLRSLARPFRARKRTVPTVSWFHPDSGAPGQVAFLGAQSVDSTEDPSQVSTGYPFLTNAPAGSDEETARAQWAADAEL